MIQVIAGQFQRSVCFLQPCHPKMTDELLAKSIVDSPSRALIVLEDIDALFGKDRQTLHEKTPLTFTGLLNALDGIANPNGLIFVLTTNYVDRLDPALVRAGRVDVKIRFPSASQEQVRSMFLRFYPDQETEANLFLENIKSHFNLEVEGEDSLSMASLQLHFIRCRTASPSECVGRITEFVEILANEKRVALEMKKLQEERKKKEQEDRDNESKQDDAKSVAATTTDGAPADGAPADGAPVDGAPADGVPIDNLN